MNLCGKFDEGVENCICHISPLHMDIFLHEKLEISFTNGTCKVSSNSLTLSFLCADIIFFYSNNKG